jgi:hypothetical protein
MLKCNNCGKINDYAAGVCSACGCALDINKKEAEEILRSARADMKSRSYEAAIEKIRALAARKMPEASREWAMILERGALVPRDLDAAMKYFWKGLEDLPLGNHIPEDANSTKGGWYACKGLYNSEAFEGLSLKYFIEAVAAEGGQYFAAGCNAALHTHGLFHTMDVYGDGKPTNTANNPDAGAINQEGDFPVAESICNCAFSIPWFKHFDRLLIDEQIAAVRKVCENYKDLLASDPKEKVVGKFFQTARKN